MASAGSRALNSPGLPPADSRTWGRWHIPLLPAALLASLGMSWIHRHPGRWLGPAAVVLISLLASGLWRAHLRLAGLPRTWAWIFASLLTVQWMAFYLHSARSFSHWIGSLGCAVFVYAMLWVLRMQEQEPGLRALATAALLLSIGILAKPAVLIGCALLILCFFLGERRRVGGLLELSLLLLTPVLLCALTLITLSVLSVGSLAPLEWVTPAASDLSRPPLPAQIQKLPAVWIGVAALLSRLLGGKTNSSDLGYVALMIFVAWAGTARWMPDHISTADLSMVIAGGAACLLALSPPRTVAARLVVAAGLSAALWLSF